MSGCFVGPYANEYDGPIDCPIEVYIRASDVDNIPPTATTFRNNVKVDLTGTVDNLGDVQLTFGLYNCEGMLESQHPETYGHYTVTLANAQVGDSVTVGGAFIGQLRASGGTCHGPMMAPTPYCSGDYDGCQNNFPDAGVNVGGDAGFGDDTNHPGDPDGSCNAGGGAGLVVAFALIAVIVRRR